MRTFNSVLIFHHWRSRSWIWFWGPVLGATVLYRLKRANIRACSALTAGQFHDSEMLHTYITSISPRMKISSCVTQENQKTLQSMSREKDEAVIRVGVSVPISPHTDHSGTRYQISPSGSVQVDVARERLREPQ